MLITESIVAALCEPVLILDVTLSAVTANPAFLKALQVPYADVRGKHVDDFFVPDKGQPELGPFLKGVRDQECTCQNLNVLYTVPTGAQLLLTVIASRIYVGEARTMMLLLELRDTTRQRKEEKDAQALSDAYRLRGVALEGMNKDLEAFTYSASHDMRTPLRLMNKIAHMLLSDHGAQLPPGAVAKINMILSSTQEMGKLIEDLLHFSQISREPIKKRSIEIHQLASHAWGSLKEERRGRDIEIAIDPLPTCMADRALLKQVLLNLLGNALKFTRLEATTKIHVGFVEVDGRVAYFVQDNGVGFEMIHADSVFDAFHRLHRGQHFEGSGVGLALVKRIIERHGGTIWAEGRVNEGATFYFTLGE